MNGMEHRHIQAGSRSSTAIMDVMERGSWDDWVQLYHDMRERPEIRERMARLCTALTADGAAQRFHFWHHVVRQDGSP